MSVKIQKFLMMILISTKDLIGQITIAWPTTTEEEVVPKTSPTIQEPLPTNRKKAESKSLILTNILPTKQRIYFLQKSTKNWSRAHKAAHQLCNSRVEYIRKIRPRNLKFKDNIYARELEYTSGSQARRLHSCRNLIYHYAKANLQGGFKGTEKDVLNVRTSQLKIAATTPKIPWQD